MQTVEIITKVGAIITKGTKQIKFTHKYTAFYSAFDSAIEIINAFLPEEVHQAVTDLLTAHPGRQETFRTIWNGRQRQDALQGSKGKIRSAFVKSDVMPPESRWTQDADVVAAIDKAAHKADFRVGSGARRTGISQKKSKSMTDNMLEMGLATALADKIADGTATAQEMADHWAQVAEAQSVAQAAIDAKPAKAKAKAKAKK